jgi:hypothetical protein
MQNNFQNNRRLSRNNLKARTSVLKRVTGRKEVFKEAEILFSIFTTKRQPHILYKPSSLMQKRLILFLEP